MSTLILTVVNSPYVDGTHVRRRVCCGARARPGRRALGAPGGARVVVGAEAVYGLAGRAAERQPQRTCAAPARVGGGRDRTPQEAPSAGGVEDLRVDRLGRGVGAGHYPTRQVGRPLPAER